MKEIGGYMQLETAGGKEYHPDALALNSGSNCLAYLIESRQIQKLYIPYFCCGCIRATAERYGAAVEYYSIDRKFRPVWEKTLEPGAWLYIVNFYGQLTAEEIRAWKLRLGRVIVDDAQAFFQQPVSGVDTLYTCRKFVGVPDGGYLYTDFHLMRELDQDVSFQRMTHILGRFEGSGAEFYRAYGENEDCLSTLPIRKMSKLTHNLLRTIDYERVKMQRTENFEYLHSRLEKRNPLQLTIPDGAFMYPLYVENGMQIRKLLQQEKIYIPTLWPDVFDSCQPESLEFDYSANILPLPVDQRYGKNEMEFVLNKLRM